MSSEFFDELISEETAIKLTDEMLRKKSEYKTNKKSKYKFINILPAAVLLVLFIGFINLISYFPNGGKEPDRNTNYNSNMFLTEPAIEPTTNKTTDDIITIEFETDFTQIIEPTIDKPILDV